MNLYLELHVDGPQDAGQPIANGRPRLRARREDLNRGFILPLDPDHAGDGGTEVIIAWLHPLRVHLATVKLSLIGVLRFSPSSSQLAHSSHFSFSAELYLIFIHGFHSICISSPIQAIFVRIPRKNFHFSSLIFIFHLTEVLEENVTNLSFLISRKAGRA